MKEEVLLCSFCICCSEKIGITMKIRAAFIECHDTESAKIKFYISVYSSGPTWFMCML